MQLSAPKFTAQLLTPKSRHLVDVNAFLGLKSSDVLARDYDVLSGEVYNVLTTAIGEEEFEPEYGSLVPNRVFDPMDAVTERLLRTDIALALDRWVPQVIVDLSSTTITWSKYERWWLFNIALVVPDFGQSSNVVVQFAI